MADRSDLCRAETSEIDWVGGLLAAFRLLDPSSGRVSWIGRSWMIWMVWMSSSWIGLAGLEVEQELTDRIGDCSRRRRHLFGSLGNSWRPVEGMRVSLSLFRTTTADLSLGSSNSQRTTRLVAQKPSLQTRRSWAGLSSFAR